MDSGFCVAKAITDIESKCVYAASLINKRPYWPRGVPGNLIDTHFEDKKFGDIVMIEARNEDNNFFEIFCMREPDYVMHIMASWVALDELEGARTKRD